MKYRNTIEKATRLYGSKAIAGAIGVTPQALYKWIKKGSLPRTDYTGETNYAKTIEAFTSGEIKAADLLQRP